MSDNENQPPPPPKKPGKVITKTVSFGGKKVTLYSLDGNTWSSRKDELAIILERQETGRITLVGEKGKEQSRFNRPPVKFQKKHDDDDEVVEDIDEDLPLDDDLEDDIIGDDIVEKKKTSKLLLAKGSKDKAKGETKTLSKEKKKAPTKPEKKVTKPKVKKEIKKTPTKPKKTTTTKAKKKKK